jgi:hypothetical protein
MRGCSAPIARPSRVVCGRPASSSGCIPIIIAALLGVTLLAMCGILQGCGSSGCKTTNLVIKFPQPIPGPATIHLTINDHTFDLDCPAQQTPLGQVTYCANKDRVVYFDSLDPSSIETVSVSVDLANGLTLFGSLRTDIGIPQMTDPDGNPGVCDVFVTILTTVDAPNDAPPEKSVSCISPAGVVTVASLPYPTNTPETIVGLALADGPVFIAVNESGAGTYKILATTLPCAAPVVLFAAPGAVTGGPVILQGEVYWSTDSGVFGVPTSGGSQTTVASVSLAPPVFFTGSADALFWIDFSGTVEQFSLGSASPTVLATGFGAGGGIAVNTSDVYFTVLGNADWNAGVNYGQGGQVLTVPIGGGDVMIFAQDQQAPSSLVLTDTDLYWVNPGTHSSASPSLSRPNADGSIIKIALTGGIPQTLLSGETNPSSLRYLPPAPLYPTLYWTDGGLATSVFARSMAAVGTTAISAEGGTGLTFDSDRVYWWEQVFNDNNGLFSSVVFSAPR